MRIKLDAIERYTCLVGTMVQEVHESSPAIRDACARCITSHAATLEADIAAVTRTATGEVVAGSLSDAVQTRDRWTFRRDIGARDPNWLLVETDEE